MSLQHGFGASYPPAAALPVIDTLIAATAITRDLTLVTRSTRDVATTGVPLFDPWQGR